MKNNLLKRILFGIPYILIIFLCTTHYLSDILYIYFDVSLPQKNIFYGFISLFFVFSMWEAIRLMNYDSALFKIITFLLGGIVFYLYSKDFFGGTFSWFFEWKHVLIVLLFIIALITIFRFSEELYNDTSKLILLAIYLGIPFSVALVLPFDKNNPIEIFYIFVLIWISDSFAYLIGCKFGKRKLAPSISPKKSIEGLIGGIIFTLIGGVVIELLLPELKGNWIIVAIIVSVFAPIGDLAESKLKRINEVKDSGKIIPGHGGLLDRLDSFIACVPFIYLYFLIDSWL